MQTNLKDTTLSRMFLSSILQTMTSCVMTINADGRLRSINNPDLLAFRDSLSTMQCILNF